MMTKHLFYAFCAIVVLFLMVNCSFTQPQKTAVLNLAAQNCGFLLAQENLPLALEIREYSKDFLKSQPEGGFTKATFDKWAGMLVKKLKLDPFLEMNFKEMVKLVNIEITLIENQKEMVELVYGVIENFIVGIKMKK